MQELDFVWIKPSSTRRHEIIRDKDKCMFVLLISSFLFPCTKLYISRIEVT